MPVISQHRHVDFYEIRSPKPLPYRHPEISGKADRVLVLPALLEEIQGTRFDVFDTDRQTPLAEGCYISSIQRAFRGEGAIVLQVVEFVITTYYPPEEGDLDEPSRTADHSG